MKSSRSIPTLLQDPANTAAAIAQRQHDLRMARTAYNYMFSYLEPIPMSADVPPGEGFSAEYLVRSVGPFRELIKNFIAVVTSQLEAEISADFPSRPLQAVKNVEAAWTALVQGWSLNPVKDMKEIYAMFEALVAVPGDLEKTLARLEQLPKDVESVGTGLVKAFEQMEAQGATAFLKYTLYDLMNPTTERAQLRPQAPQDYVAQFKSLPLPLSLALPPQPWMELPAGQQPWEQDWFFGYEQLAGFNTTNLQGVTAARSDARGGVVLATLLAKFPISDKVLQSVVGDPGLTLEAAARAGHLYVCDYAMLEGIQSGPLLGEMRFHAAPIALFYWNPQPPPGYPPLNATTRGVLQPVAIQLGQKPDPELTPIFTPRDGAKWQVAKFFVQNACAIQHETVAHLGACHLTVEPMIVATHRQLPPEHPILTLLVPHFRFTIAINDAALGSLVVPGGVVASVLSTSLDGSMAMVRSAHLAWRFDEQEPRRLFRSRGVSSDELPGFAFRDDTLLLWDALFTFVGKYLALYYTSDADVMADPELQAWVNELVSPWYACVRGMDGLVNTGTVEAPRYQIQSLEYLTRVVTQIIYIAGPQHASVNYAQYPLMSFAASASGTVYKEPPTRSSAVESPMEWMPPLDVSLYWLSFAYLLSSIQYDTLGVYSADPRNPYFADPRADDLTIELQSALMAAELEIRKRNKTRPMPYLMQLPSMIPNSISI
jgi:arachidonate 15-lipoxygenase